MGDIGRIPLNRIVQIYLYAQLLQVVFKGIRYGLPCILGNYYTSHIEADVPERIDQTQNIRIVGDADVPTHFTFLDVRRIDDNHDFHLIGKMQKHLHLAVRLESRQHARSVKIVEQFPAHL